MDGQGGIEFKSHENVDFPEIDDLNNPVNLDVADVLDVISSSREGLEDQLNEMSPNEVPAHDQAFRCNPQLCRYIAKSWYKHITD